MPSFPYFECFKKCFKNQVTPNAAPQPQHRTGHTMVSYDFENLNEMKRCLGDLNARDENKAQVANTPEQLAQITVDSVKKNNYTS